MAAGNKPVTCRNLRKVFLLFFCFFEPENSPKNVHLKCCKDTLLEDTLDITLKRLDLKCFSLLSAGFECKIIWNFGVKC